MMYPNQKYLRYFPEAELPRRRRASRKAAAESRDLAGHQDHHRLLRPRGDARQGRRLPAGPGQLFHHL
jgi:hypothetical protein